MFGAGVVYVSWDEIDRLESNGWEVRYPVHVERKAAYYGITPRAYEQREEAVMDLYRFNATNAFGRPK